MRDILTDLQGWLKEERSIALATVVRTWGSSPRGVGSKMAFTSDAKVAGSVSGGCVENAVIEAGVQSLKLNRPQLLHFGVSDETAWDVGLACGGSIDVFVKPLDQIFFEEILDVIEKDWPAVIATIVRGPDEMVGREILLCDHSRLGAGSGGDLNGQITALASESLDKETSQSIALDDELEVFFEVILPPPTLILVGGVHIAVTLTSLAKTLGFRTIVIDPRQAWGNQERFPHVDQLLQAWPEEAFAQLDITQSTAIAMLTHDSKIDDPALRIALNSPAFYVGALGSKTTNAKRRARLLDDGLSEGQLSSLRAPIGLDIGAQSPEEIALAVMAEVVDAYRKRKQQTAEMAAGILRINL